MARSVVVTLSANVAGFLSGMGQAAAAAEGAAGRIARSAQKNSADWNTVGSALTRVGAVAAVGLGVAAKAAMDWESSWAGVRKTVDQSSPAFRTLEGDLRGMARTMATSHTEIAAVAESAGALGVATEDVAGFTRTMIMLGETTNLTAGEAADSLAQFMNVMGTAPEQVGNLGSALVALGNNGASTERDIVQMGQRIAAAGKQIGMNEAEVMGFASALSSVGVEAEAGGTAISTSFFKMEQAVRNGGTQLETFAQVAGMSTAQFKTMFEQDAAGAVTAFVEGLGRVQAAGGDVTGILNELGITGIREADSLRRLASAGDLLRDSLTTAGTAMSSGTALMNEYAERANTTESKVRVAWNNIVDSAITAGQAMLPAIASAAKMVADLATAFGQLDPAAVGVGVAVAAVVAAVGLIGGGVIKAVVALGELRAALTAIGATNAASALGKVGPALAAIARFAVPAAVALGALVVIDNLRGQADRAVPALRDMTRSLQELSTTAATVKSSGIDQMFQSQTFEDASIAAGRVDGLAEAFTRLQSGMAADQIAQWWDRNIGLGRTSQATQMAESINVLDQSLVKLVETGKTSDAQSAFTKIAAEAQKAGVPVNDLATKYFPEYAASLERTAAAMGVTGLSAGELVAWMGGQVPASVQAAADSLQNTSGAAGDAARSLDQIGAAAKQAAQGMLALANAQLQLSGSQMGVEAAIDAATASLQENGRTLDITTEKGRANQAALDNIAASSLKLAQSQAEAGASGEQISASMDRNRDAFIRSAVAMGMNTQQATALADRYGLVGAQVAGLGGNMDAAAAGMNGMSAAAQNLASSLAQVPGDKTVTVTMPNGEQVRTTADGLRASIEGVPNDKMVTVTMPNGQQVAMTAGEVRAAIDGIPAAKTTSLQGDAAGIQGATTLANAMIAAVPAGKVSRLDGNAAGVQGAAALANAALAAVPNITRNINGNPAGAVAGAGRATGAIQSVPNKTAHINTTANLSGVQSAINALASVYSKTVYINTVHRVMSMGVAAAGMADGGLVRASGVPATHWGNVQRLSTGGTVAGFSPHSRADNVPIWGTAGEVMMSNRAGDTYGRRRLLAINSGQVDPSAFAAFMKAQGFADGGLVQQAYSSQWKEHRLSAPPPSRRWQGGQAPSSAVTHATYLTVNNPVTRSWSESVRENAARQAVGG